MKGQIGSQTSCHGRNIVDIRAWISAESSVYLYLEFILVTKYLLKRTWIGSSTQEKCGDPTVGKNMKLCSKATHELSDYKC